MTIGPTGGRQGERTETMVRIICSECGEGSFRPFGETAWCSACEGEVSIRHDVAPYLDTDQRLTVDGDGFLAVTGGE